MEQGEFNYKKGEYIQTNNPYVKTTPRKWTESEIEYMLQLKKEGKSNQEIWKKVVKDFLIALMKKQKKNMEIMMVCGGR